MDAKHKVGVVEHYYGNLGVAVVKLSALLRVGDKIVVEHADGKPVLEQVVQSMQIEQSKINEGKAGELVGLKLSAKVHQGNVVYKA